MEICHENMTHKYVMHFHFLGTVLWTGVGGIFNLMYFQVCTLLITIYVIICNKNLWLKYVTLIFHIWGFLSMWVGLVEYLIGCTLRLCSLLFTIYVTICNKNVSWKYDMQLCNIKYFSLVGNFVLWVGVGVTLNLICPRLSLIFVCAHFYPFYM